MILKKNKKFNYNCELMRNVIRKFSIFKVNIPLAKTAAGLMVSKVKSQNSLSSVTRSQSWKMLRCKSEIYNERLVDSNT